MEEKKNALTTISNEQQGLDFFGSVQGFEVGQRMAKMFSVSTLVPQPFQNNIGNCLIALNMSTRMKADPLMVMQSLFIIHGKPSFEAKFLIACFNASGKFSPLRYKFFGTEGKDDWGCQAYTYERATGDIIEGTRVTIGMAKAEGWYNKPGSKWKTMPELMLQYRAATFLIRTVAPEIALGFQTKEEVEDVIDITPVEEVATEQAAVEAQVAEQIQQEANSEELAIDDSSNNPVENVEVKNEPAPQDNGANQQEIPSIFDE